MSREFGKPLWRFWYLYLDDMKNNSHTKTSHFDGDDDDDDVGIQERDSIQFSNIIEYAQIVYSTRIITWQTNNGPKTTGSMLLNIWINTSQQHYEWHASCVLLHLFWPNHCRVTGNTSTQCVQFDIRARHIVRFLSFFPSFVPSLLSFNSYVFQSL